MNLEMLPLGALREGKPIAPEVAGKMSCRVFSGRGGSLCSGRVSPG